jgi:hypothetical protein
LKARWVCSGDVGYAVGCAVGTPVGAADGWPVGLDVPWMLDIKPQRAIININCFHILEDDDDDEDILLFIIFL